jgi:hypothetical protein
MKGCPSVVRHTRPPQVPADRRNFPHRVSVRSTRRFHAREEHVSLRRMPEEGPRRSRRPPTPRFASATPAGSMCSTWAGRSGAAAEGPGHRQQDQRRSKDAFPRKLRRARGLRRQRSRGLDALCMRRAPGRDRRSCPTGGGDRCRRGGHRVSRRAWGRRRRLRAHRPRRPPPGEGDPAGRPHGGHASDPRRRRAGGERRRDSGRGPRRPAGPLRRATRCAAGRGAGSDEGVRGDEPAGLRRRTATGLPRRRQHVPVAGGRGAPSCPSAPSRHRVG